MNRTGVLHAAISQGMCLDFRVFFCGHEVSLCESIRSHLIWLAQFIATCEHSDAVSMVSSGKSSMYFRDGKNIHKQFADPISLQIMLTDASLAFKWMLISLPCCFEAALLEESRCWDCWVSRP